MSEVCVDEFTLNRMTYDVYVCMITEEKRYLINLIDSPGHVDFSGEVSAAVRLCDGCLVIVDVVEGVCPQTITALKQAWTENLKPILILNKMDRLIQEVKMEPYDAFLRLQQILEQLNVIQGELFASNVLTEYSERQEEIKKDEKDLRDDNKYEEQGFTFDWISPMDEEDDSQVYFSPEAGNVIFGSAVDNWGFSLEIFAHVLSSKLGISEAALKKTLWGDYYLDTKKKRIFKGAQSKVKKPLFVQMVLENIWSVYEAIDRKDSEKTLKIIESLKIEVPKRDVNHTDAKIRLKSIFSQWLPLSNCILDMVCKIMPSPLELREERIEHLMCSKLIRFDSFPEETQKLKQDFMKCSSDETSAKIICVSKMITVDKKILPENRPRQLTPEEIEAKRESYRISKENMMKSQDGVKPTPSVISETTQDDDSSDEVFIAFARVFSGNIRTGDKLFVLGPKHDPSKVQKDRNIDPNLKLVDLKSDEHATVATINRLFILMGRELESVESVSAGNVVGIGGLEGHILKSATLSDSLFCPPFVDLHVSAPPILRVAVEPQNPIEMPKLIRGLKLLNQSDPNVEVKLQETGEHVIIASGEVHLQKCIDDLQESLAKISLNVSEPIVPFRETIVNPPKVDMVNEIIDSSSNKTSSESTDVELWTPNKRSVIRMKAVPIPDAIIELIESNTQLLKAYAKDHKNCKVSDVVNFKTKLKSVISELKNPEWPEDVINKIVSFGPKHCGPNILLDKTPESILTSYWRSPSENDSSDESKAPFRQLESNFISGFQMATLSGPLCEEPMDGVAFVLIDWKLSNDFEPSYETTTHQTSSTSFGPLGGQIMSTVKEACRKAFMIQPRRLKVAMYTCSVQVSQEALGELNHNHSNDSLFFFKSKLQYFFL